MTPIIDARTGQPFQNGNSIMNRISEGLIRTGGRMDAEHGGIVAPKPGWIDSWRAREDAAHVATMRRNDNTLGALSGDFEFIYNEVLTEPRRPNNYERILPMDTRVPLGAKTHTVRRRLASGQAEIVRGGAVPVISSSMAEDRFPVVYIAMAVETNYFELLSQSYEARSAFQDDSREAVAAIEARINDLAFNGSKAAGLFGVLDYPELAKSVASVNYVAASDGKQVVADLNRFVNRAEVSSGSALKPDSLAVSLRLRNYLFQTPLGTASDITIGDFFLRGQENIKNVVGIDEFTGRGPAGALQDAMFAYEASVSKTAFVMVQPPTALPMWQNGPFTNQVVYVAAVGGVVMRDVGSNAIQFATVEG